MEGLPDWRMPAYYFRRMRKIGLAEGLAYLLGESFPYFFREKVYFNMKRNGTNLRLFDRKERFGLPSIQKKKFERRSFKTEYDDI